MCGDLWGCYGGGCGNHGVVHVACEVAWDRWSSFAVLFWLEL